MESVSLSLIEPMCYRNHALKSGSFLIQIKIPKRKRNAKTLHMSYYCFIRKNQFLYAIFRSNFTRE